MADKPRVGFIGLGLMGMPMARNVMRAGFPLVVHNRSRGKVDQLVGEGAEAASSPAEVAERCDVVLSCLPKPPDVLKVYLGDNGAASAAKKGQIVCDMSTVDPETHQRVAEAVRARGAEYLDAPVSGGPGGARDATLTIMVGGTAEAFARAKPVFEAMGKNIYHVGPTGAGATVKLINQMMAAAAMLTAAEGLVLGTKAGIKPELLIEIISNSSGASRSFTGNAPNVLSRNFDPGFTLDLMHKDVSLAVSMARALGVAVPSAALTEQVLQTAKGVGLADRSFHAVIQPLEKAAGVEVRGG